MYGSMYEMCKNKKKINKKNLKKKKKKFNARGAFFVHLGNFFGAQAQLRALNGKA